MKCPNVANGAKFVGKHFCQKFDALDLKFNFNFHFSFLVDNFSAKKLNRVRKRKKNGRCRERKRRGNVSMKKEESSKKE